MMRDFGIFHVGLKVLLRKGDKVLFLRDNNPSRNWDVPGGRIDNVEYQTPLEKVIAREVREELGSQIKYVLGRPLFHFRRARPKGSDPAFVFLVVYDAQWKAGEVKLSREHSSYEWIDRKKFRLKREDFGQKEEYQAFRQYFKNQPRAVEARG